MKNSSRRALAAVTALTLGTGFALGAASAANAVPDTWTITALSLTNAQVVDTSDTAGDDGGYLSVTQTHLLRDGDSEVYSYVLASMTPVAATDAVAANTSFNFVSDLKSNTAYQVETGELTEGEIDTLVALDIDGNVTTNVVTLSESIDVSSNSWVMISGFGWIGMWDPLGGSLKSIDPSTGVVTTVDASTASDFNPNPNLDNSEGTGAFSLAGVGMYDGTDYWFVGQDENDDISKFNITGTVAQSVMVEDADDQGADSDTFIVSTCSNKWYTHAESVDGPWFGVNVPDMSEPVLWADATFSSAGTCPQEPELPNTGVDAGATAALVALLATLGLAGVVIARRRQVTTK